MKKVLLIIFLLGNFTFAEEMVTVNNVNYPLTTSVQLEVNGEKVQLEEPPYIVNGRTIVPIKFLMDILGYEVTWDEATQKVRCLRGSHTIEMQINKPEILIDGVVYMSDMVPVIINNRTYVPLAVIARGTGAEVTWDPDESLVRIEQKLEHFNLYYGKSSYQNYQIYNPDNTNITYAWSQVMIKDDEVFLNTSSINNNTMFIPSGYEMVMNDEKKYLNIYADKNFDIIFGQKVSLINEIKSLLLFPEENQPSFDGVVMDFENIPSAFYDDYVFFLKDLKASLKTSKQVSVALQPRDYDYKSIVDTVDYMILMLHDYETKEKSIISLSDGFVNQPITPIASVEEDLLNATKELSVHQKSKVLLQLNLSVVQWQGDNQFQMTRFTPDYNKLMERFNKLDSNNFKYSTLYENPYVVYQDENHKLNTIWYENESSLLAKINLAIKYNLGGISLWHLGNIPSMVTTDYEMNIWELIQEKLLAP
ncbi:MAG: hypothetical protein JXR88_15445 [Clostridia bacterium]|nr:hypothetical protein [Clostridia bacterium]